MRVGAPVWRPAVQRSSVVGIASEVATACQWAVWSAQLYRYRCRCTVHENQHASRFILSALEVSCRSAVGRQPVGCQARCSSIRSHPCYYEARAIGQHARSFEAVVCTALTTSQPRANRSLKTLRKDAHETSAVSVGSSARNHAASLHFVPGLPAWQRTAAAAR
jgi:hypothetical protein